MMDNEILVFSETHSSRADYIFSFLLFDLLGLNFRFTENIDEVIACEGPAIFYSGNKVPERICIRPAGLLNEQGICEKTIKHGKWGELPVIFADDFSTTVPFDIFSASFWMISRYEEYLSFTSDIYGRFPAQQSLAYRAGFLDVPVVNLWANRLAEVLRGFYPRIKINKPSFNWLATIDVDVPWAYRNHGTYKTLGGVAAAFFRGSNLRDRLEILRGKRPDPFFCFDEIRLIHKDFPERLMFFIPSGKPGKFDLNTHPANREWRELVSGISRDYTAGMHPSFRSHEDTDILKKEFDTLSGLVPYPLKNSRQHFLKMRFPGTYRNLIQLGIENDYSMGYPGTTGFRAGTCNPFYFFDLEKNEKTPLRIWPLTLMDRTLKDYMHKSPEESSEDILKIIRIVENAGGWFIPAWHNDSLSDYGEWKGWREVYSGMLDTLKIMS